MSDLKKIQEKYAVLTKYGAKGTLRKCPICKQGKLEYDGQPGDYGFNQRCGVCELSLDVDTWKWIKVYSLRDGWKFKVFSGYLFVDKQDGEGYVSWSRHHSCGKITCLKCYETIDDDIHGFCDKCRKELGVID